MMQKAETGVELFNKGSNFAIFMMDDSCPVCGHKLRLVKKFMDSAQIPCKYLCDKCGFMCPIYHDSRDFSKCIPIYDNKIKDFRESFK